eukprot:2851490-Pyramimonas_sp.AAC.1
MNVESAPEVASAAAEIEEVEHKMEDLMAAEEDPVTLQAATEERDDLKERLKVQQRAAKIQIEYSIQQSAVQCSIVLNTARHRTAPLRRTLSRWIHPARCHLSRPACLRPLQSSLASLPI